jgi:tetratricopeptide (TPR) repeat protein
LNISQAYLKLNKHVDAIDNCTKVLKEENDNLKALYRRGVAYTKLQEFDKAKVTIVLCRAISTNYSSMILRMAMLRKNFIMYHWRSKLFSKNKGNYSDIYSPNLGFMMMLKPPTK